MEPTDDYSALQQAMVKFSSEYMKPVADAKQRGGELKRPTDRAFATVFYGFAEIASALEALALSEVLLGVAPPRSSRIKKDDYLKFLIGAYLQEMYILEQRMTSYATKISRMYKTFSNAESLVHAVRHSFASIVRTRGGHVHAQRYSDEKLDMLSGLSLISAYEAEFTSAFHFEYATIRREWEETVKRNNAHTKRLVNHFSSVVLQNIAKNGRIILPRTGKGGRTHAPAVDA